HDERKAAHAAFTGQPFQPSWSSRAQTVYHSLKAALAQDPARHIAIPHPTIPDALIRTFAPSETDTPCPLQVWHLSLTHPDTRLLLLFPWHVPMTAVLQYLNSKYPNRPMTLQAIEGGQHPCVIAHSLILAHPIISSQETTVPAREDPRKPT
ncbi:MAG: hypothetical protein HOP32_15385, partial [Nitrospira sp.]|nr:hypothetical protein [Nitrospira sp.]